MKQRNILDRLKKQLMDKGLSAQRAEKVARKHLRKSDLIDETGELTEKGAQRSRMSPEERAFSRSTIPREAGWYDPVENKVHPL